MNNDKLWALTLMIIAVCTLILAGSNLAGIQLPDVETRTLGIAGIICLPVLVYATVKKTAKK